MMSSNGQTGKGKPIKESFNIEFALDLDDSDQDNAAIAEASDGSEDEDESQEVADQHLDRVEEAELSSEVLSSAQNLPQRDSSKEAIDSFEQPTIK